MANVSKINFNGEALDIKDTHAREQIQHLTSDNYTADVTGDYTINAGGISMSSDNTTMHTTADRTIDTDGNDSVHINGASTLNVGGLRTETFAEDKTETVTGTVTEKAGNRNTTVTGKWKVNLPGKSFDMKDIALISDVKTTLYVNVRDHGAIGDGVADDSNAIQTVINNNIGKTIFFPVGTYIVSKSIILPNNTTICGENHESQIKAKTNGITIFTNDAYLRHGINVDQEETHSNITIKNLTLNGNFVESPWTNYNLDQPTINTEVTGIALYGSPIWLYDVWVYNCGKYGIITVNGRGNPNNPVPINEESIFLNCVVKFNGEDGWRYLGPHDAMMCNCIIASNSRKEHNKHPNLKIEKYNMRIVNSHFYSDYGACKPNFSIILSGAQCNISNCHIEGGGIANMEINSPYNQISNCHFYASFGTSDIVMNSSSNQISNCLFGGKTTEQPGVSSDPWKGAFIFNSTFYNYIDCTLDGTSLIDDDTVLDVHNSNIIIKGSYTNHPAIKRVDKFNSNDNYISILGDFTDTATIVLPNNTVLGKISPWGRIQGINLSTDTEMTDYVSVVWSATESKTLTIPRAEYGGFLIIINGTNTWIHLKAQLGDTINNLTDCYGQPNKALILACGATKQWLTADVQATKPTS